ncbi:hypothetical protein [Caulobacter sp. 17J65-9]|uniref:hypothetical protein n=1 Tax=Caulobacter sp. 17J65-9 TaxID=2709382 RepID=UPI0013C9A2C6|nr:hypothetical protein [Caulobacter sp. 17J65-9]NEX93373.1 hypothetical protein [Caulobacter sp. 17J65-9]
MNRASLSLLAALAAVSLATTACGPKKHEKTVDTSAEPSPNESAAPAVTTAAPPVTPAAAPMDKQLDDYLKSGQTGERAFQFQALVFTPRGELGQNPNFSPTSLAAVLNAYPQARLQIRGFAAPGQPAKVGSDHAAKVAQALIQSGVDAKRVTSAGAVAASPAEARVDLVVTP